MAPKAKPKVPNKRPGPKNGPQPETTRPAAAIAGGSKVENFDLSRLTPYERNSRTHSEEQIAKIARSIERFGFRNPIIAGDDGVVIAGHGRLLAAQLLGLKTVPVIIARGMTEEERRAYVIADNQIATDAGWDAEMLKLELGELKEADFDLSLIGFNDDQLSGILDVNLGTGAEAERMLGINAGSTWGGVAEASVIYIDRGISRGMEYGIAGAKRAGRSIEYRTIGEFKRAR